MILMIATVTLAQGDYTGKTVPAVEIKTPEGAVFNTSGIDNEGRPIILSFWALWCKPCHKELNAIADLYEEWQEETGVKLVAISIDDARSTAKVLPTVNGYGWEYEVYLDPNGDFKRAMGVNMIPHLFILDGNKKVVYQHTSYSEGSEYELYDIVRKIAAGKEIENN